MNEGQKIPKIIHYCWFGHNPLPELAQTCIASWKKNCPEYEIKEWNEDNFDIHCCQYAEEAYEAKKWAFVADVARLYALVNYGGIYMDTDVEVLKPLDILLGYEAVLGFESDTQISTGLMAVSKGNILFSNLLHEYDSIHFKRSDGSLDVTTNVTRITNTCRKYGFVPNNTLQVIKGLTILPKDYFSPKDFYSKEIHLTKNSFAIHHFDGSWHSVEDNYREALCQKLSRALPNNASGFIAKYISVVKYRGLIQGNRELVCWLKRKKG